ncbi:8660_t:CDS:10 [Diversispora eburnea]|uniref:8660_t:CDS:1 n=1 Tax=Diversispora eburnea TaxID=1213867 RepID=A0A9N9F9B7_9GLOM|nr:8660_t:CDS:10 [Diversispora eburnea]
MRKYGRKPRPRGSKVGQWSSEEIVSHSPPPGSIPINKIDTPYNSIEEYLETHYRLLREDCIRPLREGIEEYINSEDKLKDLEKPKDFRKPSLRIYENINLVRVTYANVGVVHRISFRTQHGERIKWNTSKRLIPGTLVLFTKDKFKTVKFATVISRHESLLEKKWDLQIDVLFRPEDVEFVLPGGYIMVEATSSYFEAYRHVLNVLQEMDPETLPFQEHIIEGKSEIEIPKYLEKRMQSNPKYDFDKVPAFPDLEKHLGTSYIDITKDWNEWPHIDQMNAELHVTQYEALKRMLTRKLALIQGPPGTGKTYIGLAAVKILLKNAPGVIVIACQTNHALDQFLSGILDFEPEVVRLGSRSKSEKMRSYTLFNKFQSMKHSDTFSAPHNPEVGRLYKKRDVISSKMKKLCTEIQDPYISLDYIISNGILSEAQLESLKQDDWVISSSSNNDSKDDDQKNIKDWLTQSVSTHSAVHAEIEHNISEEFQAIEGGKLVIGDHSELRGDQYINSDVYINEDDLNQYAACKDLWDIPTHARAVLHNRWRKDRLDVICEELKEHFKDYQKIADEMKREKIREDLAILNKARVVGMTTTAAAKYHELLINLKPKIMIIEEAAETLEAHIATALTPYTEHLILIGLTKFLPLTKLTEQRRMRTEIRELLTPIYGDVLTDHPQVKEYPKVQGIVEDLFFFDHTEEEQTIPSSMKDLLRKETRLCPQLKSIRVSSVDGFQGEENEIIILSLVRSREPLCVALSRAKHGLYIFGNASQLSKQSVLWKNILNRMQKNSCLRQTIDLFCPKHTDIEKGVAGLALTTAGWDGEIPSFGGCKNKCGELLLCGHICNNECHFDLHTPVPVLLDVVIRVEINVEKYVESVWFLYHSIPDVDILKKSLVMKLRPISAWKNVLRNWSCEKACSAPCTTKCELEVPLKYKCKKRHANRVKCYELESRKNEPCAFCD